MINFSACFSTVIIFELHLDVSSKKLMKSVLPLLGNEGYDTLCYELSSDRKEEEIYASFEHGLNSCIDLNSKAKEFLAQRNIEILPSLSLLPYKQLIELMRLYVSSQHYEKVAEKIKNLPAALVLKEVFAIAKETALTIRGIDINGAAYQEMYALYFSKRFKKIKEQEVARIDSFTKNLIELRNQKKGTIFVCGALHAPTLLASLKKHNLNQNILYYYAYSDENYQGDIEIMKERLTKEELERHTYYLDSEQAIQNLTKKIIKEVKAKNRVYSHVLARNTSHTNLINCYFGTSFKTYARPGYHVDAVLALDLNQKDSQEALVGKMKKLGVKTQQIEKEGQNYLIISDINKEKNAQKIVKLQLKK